MKHPAGSQWLLSGGHARKGWTPEDIAQVTTHNRQLWAALRYTNGWGITTAGRDIPGFFKCLQEMYDGGYSFTDIGLVFGLTRARIHQLFRDEPLLRASGEGALVRIWSDEQSCFVPISRLNEKRIRQEYRDARRVEHKKQSRQSRKLRHGEKRAIHIAMIHNLITRLGRVPGIYELAAALGVTLPAFATYWGRNSRRPRISYASAFDNMYAAAGVERPSYSGSERPVWRKTDEEA